MIENLVYNFFSKEIKMVSDFIKNTRLVKFVFMNILHVAYFNLVLALARPYQLFVFQILLSIFYVIGIVFLYLIVQIVHKIFKNDYLKDGMTYKVFFWFPLFISCVIVAAILYDTM